MNDEQIRLSVVHLLRAYFDKSPSVDPLDDQRVVDVSHDHISALADIILYTSNPILYFDLEEKTRNDAAIILTNTVLRFKLPESLMCMIAYRHSQTNVINNEIVKIADDIVFNAKKSEDFWRARQDGQLEWGRCLSADIPRFNMYPNPTPPNPCGIEGWVPAIIEHQDIWIRSNQFDMYPGRWDRDDSKAGVFSVYLHGNHNNYLPRYVTRELLNKCPSLYGINSNVNEEDWIKVILSTQRTWIYYNPEKLSILPKSSNPDSYVKVTLVATFPHYRCCSFFAERNINGSVFVDYPRSIFSTESVPLFIDEDAPPPPAPDLNTQIIVLGPGNNSHSFQQQYGGDNDDTHPFMFHYRRILDNTTHRCLFETIVKLFRQSPYIDNNWTFHVLLNRFSLREPTEEQINAPNTAWIQWYYDDNVDDWKWCELSKLLRVYNYWAEPSWIDNFTETFNQFFRDLDSITGIPPEALQEILSDDEEEIVEPMPAPPSRRIVRRGVNSGSTARPAQLCKRIRDIIVADIISKGDECSITMEPLTAENLAITSCFHFFEKTAINKWISDNHTCPQCRERTTVFA